MVEAEWEEWEVVSGVFKGKVNFPMEIMKRVSLEQIVVQEMVIAQNM